MEESMNVVVNGVTVYRQMQVLKYSTCTILLKKVQK